jgi:peptide/nickel transport system substrate-binding protein
VYSNASDYYEPFVQSNGSTNYMIQQAELAAESVAKISVAKPVQVRVLYDSDNPRAKQEFDLLGQYATSVGFALIDVSSKEPNDVVTTGEFDLYIATIPLAGEVGGNPYWFGANPITGFTDSKVSDLLVKYGSKSKALDQISVLKDLDAALYSAGFGLPLYQVPSLLVYSKRVKAMVPAPYGGSATYGYWNWQLAGN